jgi:uncharacterized membrane protein YobD (UPF0266 family)
MTHSIPALGIIVLVLLAILALYVFIKVEHFLFKLAGGFFALLLLAAAGWWFFLRH